MGMTLAQLHESPEAGRPERVWPVCVSHKLIKEFERLDERSDELTAERDALTRERGDLSLDSDEEKPSNARVADGPDPRVAEIDARLAEIDGERGHVKAEKSVVVEKMREHTGEVALVALSPSDWQAWRDKHPVRSEDDPGWNRDMMIVGGWVNADAVIAELHLWVSRWNDEPLDEANWRFVAERTSGGTLKRLAKIAVQLQEGGESSAPKSLIASSMMSGAGVA